MNYVLKLIHHGNNYVVFIEGVGAQNAPMESTKNYRQDHNQCSIVIYGSRGAYLWLHAPFHGESQNGCRNAQCFHVQFKVRDFN